MIHELELVVLARDIPENGLQRGDVGTVVHCYEDGQAMEIEFVTASGKTIAVLTLDSVDVRPMQSGQILHVRELSAGVRVARRPSSCRMIRLSPPILPVTPARRVSRRWARKDSGGSSRRPRLLCGCGALGSAIANMLVRAGVGKLRIVDRDFVELTNLQRQSLFDEADAAGRNAEGRGRGRKTAADQLARRHRAGGGRHRAGQRRAVLRRQWTSSSTGPTISRRGFSSTTRP